MRIIAHISDLHFGKIDPPVVEALARDLHAQQPNLLIISGDLTQRSRRSQFLPAKQYLNRLPQPQLIVPGNHDVPLYDLVRRMVTPNLNFRRNITRDLRPIYRDDELLVAGINSARPFMPRWGGFWKDGSISSFQLIHLQRIFAASAPTKILVTHHPFLPAPGGEPDDHIHRADVALPILSRLGVDLLLAGHLHRSYVGAVNQTRSMLSMQAGTATSTRRRGEPNGYNLLRVEPGQVHLTVRAFNGADFVATTDRRFRRVDGAWLES